MKQDNHPKEQNTSQRATAGSNGAAKELEDILDNYRTDLRHIAEQGYTFENLNYAHDAVKQATNTATQALEHLIEQREAELRKELEECKTFTSRKYRKGYLAGNRLSNYYKEKYLKLKALSTDTAGENK